MAAACLVILSAREAVAPLVLGVAADRMTMTVDGTPRFLTFISYFDGVRRAGGSGVDADLAFLAEHVDGIRVLPNWWASTCPLRSGDDSLIDVDGRIRPSVWNKPRTAARRRIVAVAAGRPHVHARNGHRQRSGAPGALTPGLRGGTRRSWSGAGTTSRVDIATCSLTSRTSGRVSRRRRRWTGSCDGFATRTPTVCSQHRYRATATFRRDGSCPTWLRRITTREDVTGSPTRSWRARFVACAPSSPSRSTCRNRCRPARSARGSLPTVTRRISHARVTPRGAAAPRRGRSTPERRSICQVKSLVEKLAEPAAEVERRAIEQLKR